MAERIWAVERLDGQIIVTFPTKRECEEWVRWRHDISPVRAEYLIERRK
jgi:hypothetical protein